MKHGLLFCLILSVFRTDPAFSKDDQRVIATFKNSPVQLLGDRDNLNITLSTPAFQIPKILFMSTLGESDFHITYGPEQDGYMITKPTGNYGEKKLIVQAGLFAKLKGDFHESGISCDLRNPEAVLHFDKSETKAGIAFKILEFRIDSAFDGKEPRYMRVFVSENNQAFPLDIGHATMATAGVKTFVTTVMENGILTVKLSTPGALGVQIIEKSATLILNGRPVSLVAGWRALPRLAPTLKIKELILSSEEIAKYKEELRKPKPRAVGELWQALPEDEARAEPNKPAKFNVIEFFEPVEKEKYFPGSDELRSLRSELIAAYQSASVNHHELIIPSQSFEYSVENSAKIHALMNFYEAGTFDSFMPRGLALFLDLRKLKNTEPSKFFEDYLAIKDSNSNAAIIVTDGTKFKIHFALPGSCVPLSSILEMDPTMACKTALSSSLHGLGPHSN